ncbi:hypothetical protein [Psychroflexus sp. MBR-150]|jgi:hypothetical protein
MSNNSKNAGRKKGSNNLLSTKAKQKLFEIFEKDFLNIHKLFQKANIDGRGFYHLKPYAKMLTTGSDKVSMEMKSIIFKSLKPEFLRLNTYISQLSAPERAKQLRYYLQMLNKEQIEELFGEITERKKGIYKRKND